MSRLRALILGVLAFINMPLIAARAQVDQDVLPPNTVVGRLGIGTGPSQAIPFGTLSTQIMGSIGLCVPVANTVGDGVTDNTAALNAALSALPAQGGCLSFGSGKFKFGSAITKTYPVSGIYSVSIVGTGQDSTTLFWPSGNGLTINYENQQQSFHMANLSMTTGGAASGGGLILAQLGTVVGGDNMAQSDLYRVTFRGDDGYQLTDYWTTAITATGISNLALDTVFIAGPSVANGNGINYAGLTGQSVFAVVLNVAKSTFNNLASGIIYGSFVQGVAVTTSNFTGCTGGIVVPGSETGTLAQLSVINSQFGQFATGNSILTSTGVNEVILQNNLFIQTAGATNSSSVFLQAAQNYSITGNVFNASSVASQNGIVIGTQAASTSGAISGNTIGNYGGNGILLQAASARATVSGNSYFGNGTNVSDSGTTNIVLDAPVGVSAAVTMGASPFTYTAGSHPETHYVNQSATNTATIAKGTRQIATLAGATTYYVVQLGPNESYTTTWLTTAPTYTKDVH